MHLVDALAVDGNPALKIQLEWHLNVLYNQYTHKHKNCFRRIKHPDPSIQWSKWSDQSAYAS